MTKDIEYITHAPTHSDFLICWTGKDIMEKHGGLVANERQYSPVVVSDFIKRLQDILEYGLWMRKRKDIDHIKVNTFEFPKPEVARLCFTELKISDSLLHANKFGPLGIGFKRFFVVNRMGSPVYYVPDTGCSGLHPFFPPFSDFYNPEDPHEFFSFFKNMSQDRNPQGYIAYDLYEESEWRVIYSEKIKSKMPIHKQKYFIDPKDPAAGKYYEFYKNLMTPEKPDYLVPIDEWLALIIYPNLQIKNESFEDKKIRNLLTQLKGPEKTFAEGIPQREVINFPAELDIGAIRNF
jgi:hypothetical protein